MSADMVDVEAAYTAPEVGKYRQALAEARDALATSEAALQEAREALRFYAERDNWIARNPPGTASPCWADMGERATAALDSGHQEGDE